MNELEQIKLHMYQVENEVSSHPTHAEELHEQADNLLLQTLEMLSPLMSKYSSDDEHDAFVDIIAAFKRARKHFWYA